MHCRFAEPLQGHEFLSVGQAVAELWLTGSLYSPGKPRVIRSIRVTATNDFAFFLLKASSFLLERTDTSDTASYL